MNCCSLTVFPQEEEVLLSDGLPVWVVAVHEDVSEQFQGREVTITKIVLAHYGGYETKFKEVKEKLRS